MNDESTPWPKTIFQKQKKLYEDQIFSLNAMNGLSASLFKAFIFIYTQK